MEFGADDRQLRRKLLQSAEQIAGVSRKSCRAGFLGKGGDQLGERRRESVHGWIVTRQGRRSDRCANFFSARHFPRHRRRPLS